MSFTIHKLAVKGGSYYNWDKLIWAMTVTVCNSTAIIYWVCQCDSIVQVVTGNLCSIVIQCIPIEPNSSATADCMSTTNPIVLRTCTVEAVNTRRSVIFPCMLNFIIHVYTATNYRVYFCKHTGNNSEVVMLTTRDYQPGAYTVTFDFTDIYGQTVQQMSHLLLRCTFIIWFTLIATKLNNNIKLIAL